MPEKITIRFKPNRGAKVTILNDPDKWGGKARVLDWNRNGMAVLYLKGYQDGYGRKRLYLPNCIGVAIGSYTYSREKNEVTITFDAWASISPANPNTEMPVRETESA